MDHEYDVIVIGGGIHGGAGAAALSRRGYRILLLEQHDFASGATARTTKLIHGGLLHLRRRDARLAHESHQARERLLRARPHLVQPQPFLLPVYAGGPHRAPTIRAGLLLYDLLSPRKVSPSHRALSKRALQRREPALRTGDLRATYLFYDAQVALPERYCLELLREAREAGADIRNYAAVDFIVVSNGVACGVDFHDALTGERRQAAARVIVNATGPWVDAVLELTGRGIRPTARLHKASQAILHLEGRGPAHAILAAAHSDGRPIFIVPWLGHHVVGATALPFEGDRGSVKPKPWEVDYLLEEAARLLPGIGIGPASLRYAYSGLRPRRARDGGSWRPGSPSAALIDHRCDGVQRLFSVVGEEFTTAERTAQRLVDGVRATIGDPPRSGRRHAARAAPGRAAFLPPAVQAHLRARYGARAEDVAAYVGQEPDLARPLSPRHPDIGAQVLYALEVEGARTLADILLRRTPIGLTHDLGRAAAGPAAAIMAQRLHWSATERRDAVIAFRMELERNFACLEGTLPAQATPAPAAASVAGAPGA